MIPILYVSSGIFHPAWPNRLRLRALLARASDYAIREASSLEALTDTDYAGARAVVLYLHGKEISTPALERLEGFVRAGGGLLAMHSAAASFKQEPGYHALLGGRFTGHGPVGRFLVQPAADADEVFSVRADFRLRDERYLHETYGDIRVRFTSIVAGESDPFVWTRVHGAGRVCYCAAGHTIASLGQAEVRRILLDGLAWVTGGRA